MTLHRRTLLLAGSFSALPTLATPPAPALSSRHDLAAQRLREGGCVVAFRHALAPGTFDPPSFKLGDCSTQRNLSDEGRAQARRIGRWFAQQALVPAAVRSSPWCRCVDTASLAFGTATPWQALASPTNADESTRAQRLRDLQAALQQLRARRGPFEAWVTHQFVLSDLTRHAASSAEAPGAVTSGEALVLQAGPHGAPVVLARLLLE